MRQSLRTLGVMVVAGGVVAGVVACADTAEEAPVAPLPDTYAADLDDLTSDVARQQNIERLYTDYRISSGEIILAGGQEIRLVEIEPETCGETDLRCDVTDAEARAVGEAATVVDLDWLRARVRNQGGRGTCASFVINGAAEILAHREGVDVDLSEQYTYWLGHFVSSEWEIDGLSPSRVLRGLVADGERLIREGALPYNPVPGSCEQFLTDHPGTTCHPSVAQGAGEDGRRRPPEADGQDGIVITDFEKLPASLGRLKVALWAGYPVVLGINANLDFGAAGDYGGVVAFEVGQDGCSGICGHAILAVGFADDPRIEGGGYVIVRNQWAEGWGDSGLGYLTYEFLENTFLHANAIKRIEIPEAWK